jgi:hypothetical protein
MLRVSDHVRTQRAFRDLFNCSDVIAISIHLIFSFAPKIGREIKKDYAGCGVMKVRENQPGIFPPSIVRWAA